MPAFIIVCGPPASGKSRLAAHLAQELRLPVISKDLIKERLMDHFGGAPPVGAAAFDVQFAVARELLQAGTPFILEGAFFRDQSPLAELASQGQAAVIEVGCDLDTLERRYTEREAKGERHTGHRGVEALPDLRRRIRDGEYGVPDLNLPLLRVDSTSGLTPPESEVVAWVRSRLS
jgi:predicted kinase